jgi:hypothetical protein
MGNYDRTSKNKSLQLGNFTDKHIIFSSIFLFRYNHNQSKKNF